MKNYFIVLIILTGFSPAYSVEITTHSGAIYVDKIPLKDWTGPLENGKIITTGSNSWAKIKLDDGSEVTLTSSTKFILENPQGNSAPTLLVGKLRALIKNKTQDPSWKMNVGKTVMGVRGTEFILDKANEEKGSASVCTLDGAVFVKNSNTNQEAVIEKGYGVVVSDEGNISKPLPMDPLQIDWWKKESTSEREPSSLTRTDDWRWGPPPAVFAIEPDFLNDSGEYFRVGASPWFRAIKIDDKRKDLTGRMLLRATITPHKRLSLFTEGLFVAKTGHLNPEPSSNNLHQFFMLYKPNEYFRIAAGRFELDFGTGLVLGKNTWSSFTRFYDGAILSGRTGFFRSSFFYSSTDEIKELPSFTDKLAGVYLDYPSNNLGMYLLFKDENKARNFKSLNLGEHFEIPFSPFLIEQELSAQYNVETKLGDRKERTAYIANVNINYSIPDTDLDHVVRVNHLRASNYNQVMPDTHRFTGLTHTLSNLNNIQKFGAAAEVHPWIFHRKFRFMTEVSEYTEYYSKSNYGREIDFQVSTHILPTSELRFGYGKFTSKKSSLKSNSVLFLMGEIHLD